MISRIRLDAYDEPTTVTAVDGEVVLSGPYAVAVSMTPDAAEESARRILAAAGQARLQKPRAKVEGLRSQPIGRRRRRELGAKTPPGGPDGVR